MRSQKGQNLVSVTAGSMNQPGKRALFECAGLARAAVGMPSATRVIVAEQSHINQVADEMQFSDAGLSIRRWCTELPNKFPAIECDVFICIPHPFIGFVGADT